MKKIIFSLLILAIVPCFANNVQAPSADISQMTNQSIDLGVMPSDDEIREVINKYNFSDSQKEYLFRETKSKLQALYNQSSAVGTEKTKTKKKP